jgi:spore coat polysaccharide biosynthesis predicted glycosyltransferase SpsG
VLRSKRIKVTYDMLNISDSIKLRMYSREVSNPSILFRCDGSPQIGFGHVVRCIALADELRDVHGCKIAFAIRKDSLGRLMIREKGYHVMMPDDLCAFDYTQWLYETIDSIDARVLILDVRDDLPVASLNAIKAQGILIVTIDDPSERRLVADLAFYPPVPQVKRMNWVGFTGKLYSGWEWVLLRKEFSKRPQKVSHSSPVVLITMGGSDPYGLTLKAVKALDLLGDDFNTIVLLGPGFMHLDALKDLISKTRRCFILEQNVKDIPSLMAQADLALGSFGVTAYELAAMGVPGIYMCLTEDHAESASVFVEIGISICLGVYSSVTPDMIAAATLNLLRDPKRREIMSRRSLDCVDGLGSIRIAEIIIGMVDNDDKKMAKP